MSEYTIHETDVEGVQLPGRFHKMIVQPENMACSTMCAGVAFFPGKSHAPEHVHEQGEEILYVLEGRGYMYFDGEKREIKPGMFMFAPKGVVHSIEATSEEDVRCSTYSARRSNRAVMTSRRESPAAIDTVCSNESVSSDDQFRTILQGRKLEAC